MSGPNKNAQICELMIKIAFMCADKPEDVAADALLNSLMTVIFLRHRKCCAGTKQEMLAHISAGLDEHYLECRDIFDKGEVFFNQGATGSRH
jgi:hypothetical protein